MHTKAWLLTSVVLVATALAGAGRTDAVAHLVAESAAPAATRILYSSDWSGSGQIYAVDPAKPGAVGQVTFGRPSVCPEGAPCGYDNPIPSPDRTRLLFTDYVEQGPMYWNLYVARADGRSPRRLAQLPRDGWGVPFAAWSPDSRRVAYRGEDGIHVVRANGAGDSRVRTSVPGDRWPAWSPDGHAITFIHPRDDGASDLVRLQDGKRLVVARGRDPRAVEYAWSPDGRWIAITESRGSHGVALVSPDGSRRRNLDAEAHELAWSPDGRFLAFADETGVRMAEAPRYRVRTLSGDSSYELAWSPDSRRLAFASSRGIELAEAPKGRARVLLAEVGSRLSWSPDGRSIAYLSSRAPRVADRFVGDLRVASLSGRSRTLVAAIDDYGGSIGTPVWNTPAAGTRYRKPSTRTLAITGPDSLQSRWPIDRIATDGDRVAYSSCGHVFVWAPAEREVFQAEPSSSLSPACASSAYYTSYHVYGLALAGDRVVTGAVQGGISRGWSLTSWTASVPQRSTVLESGYSTNGPAYGDVVGEPQGSGDLLVFSSWREDFAPPPDTNRGVTTRQDIRRVPAAGCPCPVIASSPGPLVPLDVDRDHVVAAGDNETWLLDADGARLLTLAVSPMAAQLFGRDLVLVRQGELRHHDASTGELLHTWPLPDVSTGRECSSPNGHRCWYEHRARLVLQDAAQGLVAYVLDGQVRLLRLSDGAEASVAAGSLARFTDAGLVVADGGRLELVPFDRLPLR